MRPNKNIFLLLFIVGSIVPTYFFIQFFIVEDFNQISLIKSWVRNYGATGITADAAIALVVFWIWSFYDSKRLQIDHWWVMIVLGLGIGVCSAMPLYFYRRADKDIFG
ncbi:MAG: DUF2834 domain-containing protein [Aureispira sp.]|nr:DUF2834 domain-containing protein [Aureispira sp.]